MSIPHIKRLLYYWRCLFSMLKLDARYVASYGSKHTSQSHSDNPFVCTYVHSLRIIQVIYGHSAYLTTALLLQTSCVVYSYMRDPIGELRAPDTHRPFSVRILQTCTYIAIWCATTHDNKTHVPYDCLLCTKRQLYSQ